MLNRVISINGVLACGFVFLLLIPLCVQLLPYTEESNDGSEENRIFAKAPSLPTKLDDWLSFPARFENYYKDNFGLRVPMLSVATNLKRVTGISPNAYAQSGKDGWLFLGRQRLKDSLQRYHPMEEEDLVDFSRRMTQVGERLRKRGILFVHFAAPEKQSIYPEYLPSENNNSRQTRLDQVSQALEYSDDYIDVRKVLVGEKLKRPKLPLYPNIDSHWNCFGAYLVYREVVTKGLIDRGPQLSLVSEEEFTLRTDSRFSEKSWFSLDFWLGSMSAHDIKYECLLDDSPLLKMHLPDGTSVPNINGEEDPPESTFKGMGVFSALYQDWRSSDKRETAQLKAVVIRDSFASRLVPYLSRTFSEVLYLHYGTFSEERQIQELIEEFQPDVVIYEYAERRLDFPEKEILIPIESILENPSM